MSLTNLLPADELASVRSQIRDLENREAQLRRLMLDDPKARTGNNFIATIRTVEREQLDIKELKGMFPEIVTQFTFNTSVQVVALAAIDPETGEIKPLAWAKRNGK